MYRLVVFTLGVDNLNGLSLIDKHTTITDLSAHLTIERGVIEHHLIELILLLRHLAVTENMTLIFGIVITHKLLLACSEFRPVGVLDGSGIAGTLLLLLHLYIELCFIDGKTVLTTDQLSQIEGESIGIEEAESLHTIKFRLTLSLQLIHGIAEHTDTLIERPQERLFLFLNHLGDQLLLSLQLWEGITHLCHQCRHEFMQETVLLSEEGISITHSTTQDTTDDIACLRIRGELSVSNRETHGSQMVSADTHGHVDLILFLADRINAFFLESKVFQSRNLLFSLDDRLEDIRIIVRVLALQHTDKALETHTRINDVHRKLFQ